MKLMQKEKKKKNLMKIFKEILSFRRLSEGKNQFDFDEIAGEKEEKIQYRFFSFVSKNRYISEGFSVSGIFAFFLILVIQSLP